ncbi:hypothetical protein V8F33_001481 [Rhypophila sp. PSN 637]
MENVSPSAPAFREPSFVVQQAIHNHLRDIAALLQPPIQYPGNTVLAVVKFPSDAGPARACDGSKWHDTEIVMNHDKLVSLGSSKIQAMFSPRSQARIRRTLGFTTLPPGIEYVLDFTPPAEGAELADLTAALWLPRMVRLWFLAGHYLPDDVLIEAPDGTKIHEQLTGDRILANKASGACLVLGHDDCCKHPYCLMDNAQWEVNSATPGIFEDSSDSADKHIPEFRKVDDYCPIRHRVSIIRILHAINGRDLLLNSATRMWTIAQTAIHLEVPQVVVDPVMQWLIAPPNTKFAEISPERAFQLAYALQIPGVLITTFKILVSELAVDLKAPVPSPVRPAHTWIGRPRDDYGDFPSDPVDYAARAFVDRVTGYVDMLLSDNVFDRIPGDLQEWRRLLRLKAPIHQQGTAQLRESFDLLVEALTAAFHRSVRRAMDDKIPDGRLARLIEAERAHYLPAAGRAPIQDLYQSLSRDQRIMTPFFWRILKDQSDYRNHEYGTHKGRSIKQILAEFYRLLRLELLSSNCNLDIPGPVRTRITHTQSLLGEGIDFDQGYFWKEVSLEVSRFCDSMILPRGEAQIPLVLSDHLLLTLADDELRFLPIWAEGLDDGTGGVFQDTIPAAEMGPSEPGPGYHTGYTVATDTTTTLGGGPSTFAPSDLGLDKLETQSITIARSVDAQHSITTGHGHNINLAAGSAMGESDAFSANDEEYTDAMYAQPAAHQALGQALASYVENDDESTIASFTIDGDSVAEAAPGQQGPAAGHDNGNNSKFDFDMMDDMEGDFDLSDAESDITLGGAD